MIEMEGSDIDELDGLVSNSQAPNLDTEIDGGSPERDGAQAQS